jgi:ferredoxin
VSTRDHDERIVGCLRVRIDRTLCVGFGDCVTESPEAFVLGDDDVVVFLSPESVNPLHLQRACASCPVDALTLFDDQGNVLAP